jgi:hypothetical protein
MKPVIRWRLEDALRWPAPFTENRPEQIGLDTESVAFGGW